ncbi:MAG: type I-E CRISPR-associated protein Cse2/CasB, partial [Elusimicrobia bacterium]|nr:type I-E CRISPR-associated protein Cse2/CasB [Elusimicrobiota bacterium]
MTENLAFSSGREVRGLLRAWWEELKAARGDRAQLRRCRNVTEVAFFPAYHRLCRALPALNHEKLAAVAGLLAHVDEDDSAPLAERMATPKGEGRQAPVSGLRFRRLLRIQKQEELYRQLIRVLRMLDKRADIFDLAQSVYEWNDNTRKRWAE